MSVIYLDSAATTQLDEEVVAEMTNYLRNVYGNPSSIHALGRQSRAAIEKARKQIAQLINASTTEIFFTSGGTESNNMVLKNCIRDLGVTCIISSKVEHHCVLDTVEHLANNGLDVEYVNVDRNGFFDLEHLDELLTKHKNCKVLVSLIHANNEIGTINDMKAIGELCKKHNAFYHADTVQTIAHYDLDLENTNVHFVSCSAHKFHGPKGIGFVYINSESILHPYIHGGGQERNMRAGTENISGIMGLTKALSIAYEELETIAVQIQDIKDYMVAQLEQKFTGLVFNSPLDENGLYTVLNVTFPVEMASDMLLLNLDINGICASAGSACSSGASKQSHVIEAIGVKGNNPTIRFSFSKYTTKEDIDTTIGKLDSILSPYLVTESV